MDPKKRKALEAAGWRFGDAADFLRMSDEERQLLDARVEAALAVRRQRQACGLSQKQLADRINTSQPRIAKIERAAPDVSLDQILRAFAAAGGRVAIRKVSHGNGRESAKNPARLTGSKGLHKSQMEIQVELLETAR